MTELVASNYENCPIMPVTFLDSVADFGFNLPQELRIERETTFASFPQASLQLIDAVSDHLDRCGRFYNLSEEIQNSDRRLEINQGLLLYSAELWYETKSYHICLTTLSVLKEDILRSRDMKHLALVTTITERITDEYATTFFEQHV